MGREPDQPRKEPLMSATDQQVSKQQRIVNQMHKLSHTQPPLVYAGLGLVCGAFWALGTSVQVLTSEAWMMKQQLDHLSLNAFGQVYDASRGQLPGNLMIPFLFGWGVQMALVVASIG